MRYFIEFSYKGTNYAGWQRQKNAVGVQEIIENALSKLLKNNILITGSSRTDTGVHAAHQVAHFDLDCMVDINQLIFRLNSLLPLDIAIKNIKPVRDDVHARYDAISRSYKYVISRTKNPFLSETSYYWYGPVDIELLRVLSDELKQYHEFKSFCKGNDPKHHYRCVIIDAHWETAPDQLIFNIKANRFLRGMVRSITGTMFDMATGKMQGRSLHDIIQSGDIKRAGHMMPACGLTLIDVEYPEDIYL